tara:strand:+ start:910 stop:1113 length:204 start_codon:yes stop_codon:yes gene_type:complete
MKILPCPFCGSSDIEVITVSDEFKLAFDEELRAGFDKVGCLKCGLEAYGFTIKKWNTRSEINRFNEV